MILLSQLQVRRGVHVLLDNANATINPGQKVGLVGKNGCGKSTLFALLKGELTAEAGDYSYPSNWELAWVNQETPALEKPALDYVIDGDREFRQLEHALTLANERNDGNAIAELHGKLDAIHAWSIESRAATLLNGLGFTQEQLTQSVSSFSGGWRMRLNLAQALICRSDLLLLDEPTNHLDLDAVIWLEKWLKSYTGTLIPMTAMFSTQLWIKSYTLKISNSLNIPVTTRRLRFNERLNSLSSKRSLKANKKRWLICRAISTALELRQRKQNRLKAELKC